MNKPTIEVTLTQTVIVPAPVYATTLELLEIERQRQEYIAQNPPDISAPPPAFIRFLRHLEDSLHKDLSDWCTEHGVLASPVLSLSPSSFAPNGDALSASQQAEYACHLKDYLMNKTMNALISGYTPSHEDAQELPIGAEENYVILRRPIAHRITHPLIP